MINFWVILWGVILLLTTTALIIVAIRLNKAAKRVSRSIDPIDQKLKALRLEVSALQRARSSRQRRLKPVSKSSTKKG